MDWFKRWWKSEPDVEDDHDGGPLPSENGDWVVLPWRIAEGARQSMYVIANHPDMPPHMVAWIVNWLNAYNTSLVHFFGENYGPDIFPVLEQITATVRATSDEYHAEQADAHHQELFDRWEAEISGNQPPSNDPPSAS